MMPQGWGPFARHLALGFEFAAAVVAGVAIGVYLDGRLGTGPWLVVLLTLAALVGVVARLLWVVRRDDERR